MKYTIIVKLCASAKFYGENMSLMITEEDVVISLKTSYSASIYTEKEIVKFNVDLHICAEVLMRKYYLVKNNNINYI